MPADAGYRLSLEKMARERLALLQGPDEQLELERKLKVQLEELVEELNDELSLLPSFLALKPWEGQEGAAVQIEFKQ